ncbi:MAG: ATP/GTP-binding protein [Spirulina sp.]
MNFITPHLSQGQILVKKKERDIPLLLESMGGGMIKLLTFAILAVSVENGCLLIDEIDTGLHYGVQAKMWKLLMEVAKQLNVQIFATTHSWDCIEAFQEAMEELEDESIGKLFRISNKYGKLRPVEYVSDEIAAAVRQGIEVR